MLLQNEIDTIVKGIELAWTTCGKMRGEKLVSDDISLSYVKSETEKGFERIFSVNIEKNAEFRVQQMISLKLLTGDFMNLDKNVIDWLLEK